MVLFFSPHIMNTTTTTTPPATTTETKLLTTIPFSGFYDTCHSDQLERSLGVSDDDFYYARQEDEQNTPPDKREYPTEEELNERYESIDWPTVQKDYVEQYAANFANEYKIQLEFDASSSPRFYNFTNDRIFCYISPDEVTRIFKATNKEKLRALIKEHYTSRDGFSSHYDNDLNNWLLEPLTEWDHNQLGTLLKCYVEQECGYDGLYMMECELSVNIYV